ncbi:glycosyltransferase family 25 protein [Teratosphaeria destructans]|uniref:Glycosyltransferase family 25 protein n=1 Tax=Teratosphaeria destructans TaxID=418781 RepID=A0A9W7SMW4_9PEZI|nr:glycosyltransferase family 25 protein [Teratosphaeria destructans]
MADSLNFCLPVMASLVPALTRRSVLLGIAALVLSALFLLATFSQYSEVLIPSRRVYQNRPPELIDDTLNSTLGFQKIIVINLAKRTDRRDRMAMGAAMTGLKYEFLDAAPEVNMHALPPGGENPELNMRDAHFGNWRSHMNAALKMVTEGISTALILEDDADWDIRIKSQMRDYARASQLLLQPLRNTTDQYLDPTFPRPSSENDKPSSFYVGRDDNRITKATTSPYGDAERWDMHWLGHCGVRFPYAQDEVQPLARAVILNDSTVTNPAHLTMQFGDQQLLEQYPPHTRAVSRGWGGVCTQAYAISNRGARKILWEMGLKEFNAPTDIMLRQMCDGVDGRRQMRCLFPQPALFLQHRPRGNVAHESSIEDGKNTGYVEKAVTPNLRLSTMVNLERLAFGDKDLIDQYEDHEDDYKNTGQAGGNPDYWHFGVTLPEEDDKGEAQDSEKKDDDKKEHDGGHGDGDLEKSEQGKDDKTDHKDAHKEPKSKFGELWKDGKAEHTN